MSSDASIIIKNFSELLATSTNVNSFLYDLLINPEPMNIAVKQYNSEGKIVDISIPNRAKEKANLSSGEGSPEGLVEANLGSFYIDTLNNGIFFKRSDELNTGWVELLTDLSVTNLLEESIKLAKDWANKETETVDGIEYSSKYYATSAKNSSIEAKDWANKENLPVDGTEFSAKYYSNLAKSQVDSAKEQVSLVKGYSETAGNYSVEAKKHVDEAKKHVDEAKGFSEKAGVSASNSEGYSNLSKDWANKETETVDGLDYSSKYYSNLSKEQAIKATESASAAVTSLESMKEQVNEVKDYAVSSKVYSNLSKDWASKEKETVDGVNYSSKYYAGLAKEYSDNFEKYSNLSKDWAIKEEETVDGVEYSSKYYATLSKNSADAAKRVTYDLISKHNNNPEAHPALLGAIQNLETSVDQKFNNYPLSSSLSKVATSGEYTDLLGLPSIPSIEGLASTVYVDTKISDATKALASKELVGTKVDKENGKSLILTTEIDRLATLKNYDDSGLVDDISKLKASTSKNQSDITTINSTLNNKQNTLTPGDNISISNNVISAAMYNDTEVKESIQSINSSLSQKQGVLTAGDGISISEDNVITNTKEAGKSNFNSCLKVDLPNSLEIGVPIWCTDTKELYVGTGSGVHLINPPVYTIDEIDNMIGTIENQLREI